MGEGTGKCIRKIERSKGEEEPTTRRARGAPGQRRTGIQRWQTTNPRRPKSENKPGVPQERRRRRVRVVGGKEGGVELQETPCK